MIKEMDKDALKEVIKDREIQRPEPVMYKDIEALQNYVISMLGLELVETE